MNTAPSSSPSGGSPRAAGDGGRTDTLEIGLSQLAESLETRPPLPWAKWLGYIALHLALGPAFGLKSLRRARMRCKDPKEIWKAMTGGERPPHPTPRLLLIAGGLGETRVADAIAKKLRAERGVECAILTRSDDAFTLDVRPTFIGRLAYNNPIAVPILLARWKPKAIVTIEFNDYHHLKALALLKGIRQLVINVPITEQETQRVLKKSSGVWRWRLVDGYLASYGAVADRLRRIGVPLDRILVTGPLGFLPALGNGLTKEDLGLAADDGPVILAGSTYPVDEPAILVTFDAVLERCPRAVLILVPRHLSRPEGADGSLGGRSFVRRSDKGPLGSARILLLDTYGELKEAYACADLAIVGGTYGMDHGGHTPAEAIARGVPTLIGPNHRQHVHTVEWLAEAGAAFVFDSPERLQALAIELLTNPQALITARASARRVADEREDPTLAVYDRLIAPAMR